MAVIRNSSFFLVSVLLGVGVASAAPHSIDSVHSRLTIRVEKTGMFSALGHDHEIAVPIASGTVDTAAGTVELRVNASALKVLDPKASDKDKSEIQTTMVGPSVLDTERFPSIVFRAKSTESDGGHAWSLRGDLNLHGQTRPVAVDVHETSEGHYQGTAVFRQSEFGISPIKIAGGAVRVKDEIRVEFDIQLAR